MKVLKTEFDGIREVFVQDNHSCSARGTIRGLHTQRFHPQGKLIRVLQRRY
jgi:dTDP-4-dehydrorhamnose 3,5-epimerase